MTSSSVAAARHAGPGSDSLPSMLITILTMFRRLALPAAALLLTGIAVGCGTDDPETDDPGQLRVVATTSIIGDITAAVGGDDIALTTLIGPDQDSHTYEPTPSDSRALADADLVIENGRGLEPFLDDLVAASGSEPPRVALSAGITLDAVPRVIDETPPVEESHGDEEADSEVNAEHGDDHSDGSDDPHIWQTPWSGRQMARAVQRGLTEADPENAADYAERAADYDAELRDLEREIADLVAEIPVGARLLVTNHDTFAYFARAFGFGVVGVAIPATTTEASGSSAGEIADLVRKIEASGARAVFAENIASDDLITTIAEEAGVVVGGALYSDALGGPDSPAASYIDMQRHNAATIHAALTTRE